MQIDFNGKVVVITGAGGAICSLMARAFAQNGAKVAALNRSTGVIDEMEKELCAAGYVLKAYQADVLQKDSLETAHGQILKDLGPCDILINGAGGNSPKATTSNEFHRESREGDITFFDLDGEGVDAVFKLNFQGALLPTQVFARDMVKKNKGCILNISSMNAYSPLTKIPAYSAAKAGISNFTQWLAVHFAPSGIRCNAIAPGFVLGKQNKALLYNEDGSLTPRSNKILNGTAMGRFVEAEELLGATLFLCDDYLASAITGVVLPVDAGFSCYSGV